MKINKNIRKKTTKSSVVKLNKNADVAEILGVKVYDSIQYIPPPSWNISAYDYHQLLLKASQEQAVSTISDNQPQHTNNTQVDVREIYGIIAIIIVSMLASIAFMPIIFVALGSLIYLSVQLNSLFKNLNFHVNKNTKNTFDTPVTRNLEKLHKRGGLLLPVNLLSTKEQNFLSLHSPADTDVEQIPFTYRKFIDPKVPTQHIAYLLASSRWGKTGNKTQYSKLFLTNNNSEHVSDEWQNMLNAHKTYQSLLERLQHTNIHNLQPDTVKQLEEKYLELSIIIEDINTHQRVSVMEEDYINIQQLLTELEKLSRNLWKKSVWFTWF